MVGAKTLPGSHRAPDQGIVRSIPGGPILLPAAWAFWAWAACGAGEPQDPGTAGVEVDRARGEVRIPCWFVNPTQKLEVFACHESGPTHETVVAFRGEGEEIHRALREAGFRGPEFWNATSARDLLLTGGDRALVSLRWERKGTVTDVSAEEILVEETTGLPLYIRGFTFGVDAAPGAGSSARKVPKAVELTIGGVNRQSATFSVLRHVNDSREMLNWSPAPEVDMGKVPDLEALVEERTPCTLIIRRLQGEAALVDLALGRERSPARKAVRQAQKPLAAAIDARKAEFEGLVGEIRRLLAEGEGRKDLAEEEKKAYAGRIRDLMARGLRLGAGIHEQYLRLWDLEERQRFLELKDSPRLDWDQMAWVEMAYGSGFRFELALAAREVQAADLAAKAPAGGQGAEDLLRQALEKEMEALRLERERRWALFKLQQEIRPKLKSLDPTEEEYVIRLFKESELRAQADLRLLRSRVEGAMANAVELRARAGGTLDGVQERIARRRKVSVAAERLSAAESSRVDLLEKVRWAEQPLADSPPAGGDAEKKRLEADLARTMGEIGSLRKALEEASGRPALTGEEPPDDGAGKALFPGDIAAE